MLEQFNVGLAELKDSGQYQEIVDEFLASDDQAVDRSTFWGLVVTAMPALLTGLKNTLIVTAVAFVVLALNGAAYIAGIVRGGVQLVDPGQMEAARSLGLGHSKSMQKVVLPQALKIMTPSLINQLVIMLKDSSLLLAIGFAELLYQAQQIDASNFRVTEVLLIVAVIYFVAITLLTQLANFADRKIKK